MRVVPAEQHRRHRDHRRRPRIAAGILAGVAAYDPQWIVLSGYLSRLWDVIGPDVLVEIQARVARSPVPLRALRGIVPGRLGSTAVTTGASLVARDEVLRDVDRFAPVPGDAPAVAAG
ncbi:MAG TPA: hypothetical protein VGC67_10955 [Cellulomonas sp.]